MVCWMEDGQREPVAPDRPGQADPAPSLDAHRRTATHSGGPIVIIGGGVIGLSIAFHLTMRGYRDVTVIERHTLASGATAHATGGVRQQFSSAINIALSRRAVDFYEHFEERVGEPILFRQHGYLFLLDRPEVCEVFRANAARQNAAGIPTRMLTPQEIGDVMPGVRTDDLAGASYCPTDGSASPNDVALALARQARSRGARILEETAVAGITRDTSGAVAGVQTSEGTLEAALVINAAGPWATEIGRMVGLEIPVEPHRRQAFGIAPLPWLSPDLPMTIDFATGAYAHPGGDGAIIGGTDRRTPAGYDATVDWRMAEPLIAALVHRIPAMAEAEIRGAWCGLREMTPDDHGILGPADAVPGFWVAAGFSGHGFMHAPAVGEQLAAWLLTGAPSLDLAPLRLSRFAAAPAAEAVAF